MHACMACMHALPKRAHHAQGLDFGGGGGSSGGSGGKASVEELAEVYDIVLTHGFREEHVQQALQARGAAAALHLARGHLLHGRPVTEPCTSPTWRCPFGSFVTPSPGFPGLRQWLTLTARGKCCWRRPPPTRAPCRRRLCWTGCACTWTLRRCRGALRALHARRWPIQASAWSPRRTSRLLPSGGALSAVHVVFPTPLSPCMSCTVLACRLGATGQK